MIAGEKHLVQNIWQQCWFSWAMQGQRQEDFIKTYAVAINRLRAFFFFFFRTFKLTFLVSHFLVSGPGTIVLWVLRISLMFPPTGRGTTFSKVRQWLLYQV